MGLKFPLLVVLLVDEVLALPSSFTIFEEKGQKFKSYATRSMCKSVQFIAEYGRFFATPEDFDKLNEVLRRGDIAGFVGHPGEYP
jgi:hypothetical protein